MAGVRKEFSGGRDFCEMEGISGQELRRWALEEMRFRPQGRHVNSTLPNAEDFQRLCRGAMVDVWKFVIKYARSSQGSHKIRGNVKLQNLLHKHKAEIADKNDERGQLQQEYTQTNRELIETEAKIGNILKEIKHLEKDILKTEQAYDSVCQEISNLNKRSELLKAHSQQCKHICDAYQDLSKQIQGRVDMHREIEKKTSGEPTYYVIQQESNQGLISGTPSRSMGRSTPTGLESACTRGVREACEAIGSYLQEIYEADLEDKESSDDEKRKNKDQLWRDVENILSQHPPWKILTSLAITAQDSGTSLRELTGRINLKKDAEDLKFLYEKSGKLVDKSSPPTLLQSVHQLIEEGQAQHFQQFLDTEKSLNQAWKSRKLLQSLHNDMEARLGSRFRGMPGSNDLARALYQCELELTASRASLAYLQSSIADLNQTRSERRYTLDHVHRKHRRIEDFEKLAQAKQSVIQVLVKQNFAAGNRLEKQKLELQHYVHDKVCPHQAHVKAMAHQLRDGVYQEVDKFASLPLNRLTYTDLEGDQRVPVDDLSIYRLQGVRDRPGGAAVTSVLDRLEFPPYKAAEELLPKAVEVKQDIADTESLVHRRQQDICNVGGSASAEKIVSHLNTLQQEVKYQDSVAMDQVLPRVNESLARATRALSDCIAAKDIANSWWEQPAQFVVPWKKVEGMNMRQWNDQWTLNATRLRQLQMYQH